MMYDGLIKNLRHDSASALQNCEFDFVHAWMLEAADAIEELEKQLDEEAEYATALACNVPHWIPVTERLPECDLGAEVGNIEWISCGMVHAGCFGRGGKYRDAYFRTWTDAGEGMDAKDADYWRAVTLPQPPEDGEP